MDQNIATILSMENKMNELDGDITEFEAAVKQSKTEQRKLKKMKLDLMEMWGVTEEQIAPHRPKKEDAKPEPEKEQEVKPEDKPEDKTPPTTPSTDTPKTEQPKAPDKDKGINLNNKK